MSQIRLTTTAMHIEDLDCPDQNVIDFFTDAAEASCDDLLAGPSAWA
jgi:hypothetical protein